MMAASIYPRGISSVGMGKLQEPKNKPRYGNPVRGVTEIHITPATEIRSAFESDRYGNPVHRDPAPPLRKSGAYLDNHLSGESDVLSEATPDPAPAPVVVALRRRPS